MFAYRVGRFGWRLFARLGMPLLVKVSVTHDQETKLFVAECNDFFPYLGIVTEGETVDILNNKLKACCSDAFEEVFKNRLNNDLKIYLNLVPNPLEVMKTSTRYQ